ncbi:MAG: DUF599 family protein [Gammaproteobacteria bacterium]|nr:DUF599 family protein [Gammaproteobacteria bacterium]
METVQRLFDLYWLDGLALAWFLVAWFGYARFASWQGRRRPSLATILHQHRLLWMQRMLARDNRVADGTTVALLERNVSFFASTTILILAGLLTLLGAAEKVLAVLYYLPISVKPGRALFELKVLLLVVSFVYAFFKFTWAMRQYNFVAILIGGAPAVDASAYEQERFSAQAADILSLAGNAFNFGLRAYYFSLGALAWFLHPLALILAASWVVSVLYRREFHAKSLRAMTLAAG